MKNRLITKIYKPYSVWGIKKESTRNTVCNELRKAYQAIEEGDLEQRVATGLDSYDFKRAVDYLVENHETLKNDPSREPVIIT